MTKISQLEPGQSITINGIKVSRYSRYLLTIPQTSGQSLQITQATVDDVILCIKYWVNMLSFGVKKHDQLRYYGGVK